MKPLSESNMASVILAFGTTIVGSALIPHADIFIKIFVPILVGVLNNLANQLLARRDKRRAQKGLNP